MLFPALIIFVITYVLMIVLPKYRSYVALASAFVYILLGVMPIQSIISAINWNVLLMLAGTMGTVAFFIESKMPNKMADVLLQKAPNVMWVAVIMSLFAGIISAFVDNVATVLMVAPVGLAISKKLKISPVPMLISISVSSNLQGAATLVGDTTSILLGGYAKMNFIDFIFMNGKFGIFWAVELGALATVPVIMFIFRKNRQKIVPGEITKVTDYFPTIMLLLNIALLIAASFIQSKPEITNGLICAAIFVMCAVRSAIVNKNFKSVITSLKEIDYATLLLLTGLFIVIASISNAGVIDNISQIIVKLGAGNVFLMYTIIVFGSVLLSAFIDNIPYVATMLPVVQGVASLLGCSPFILYYGLLIGATLGGNITPIGASANIAAIGILNKEGYEVKNSDFFKIGIPFTFVAVLVGYLFCWFVWA